MKDLTCFGTAGVPGRFKEIITAISAVPNLLHAEGLEAFEYPAVRWGDASSSNMQNTLTWL